MFLFSYVAFEWIWVLTLLHLRHIVHCHINKSNSSCIWSFFNCFAVACLHWIKCCLTSFFAVSTMFFLHTIFCLWYWSLAQISEDLNDLESVLKKDGKRAFVGNGKCSALVKVVGDNKELFVAHDTWSGYNAMLRILKKYSFGYHLVPGQDFMGELFLLLRSRSREIIPVFW